MIKSEKGLTILLVVSMCIWGASWSSAKVLSQYGTVSAITFVRFIIIPLTLFPFLWWQKIPLRISKKGTLPLIAAGGLMAFYTLFFFKGIQAGLPGAGGVLVTISIPLIAYLIGIILTQKLPQKHEIIGLLLGLLAGSILLNVWVNFNSITHSGNSYFLIAALVWAVMNKITSHSANYGHPISFNVWLHVVAIGGLVFFTDFSEVQLMLQNGDSTFWLNVLYFGVINSSVATTTYFFATTKLGAEKASSFIFIVPSGAVFFSWLLMGESITTNTVIGGVLGIAGVLIINGKFKNLISK